MARLMNPLTARRMFFLIVLFVVMLSPVTARSGEAVPVPPLTPIPATPEITQSADRLFTLPGDPVTWTITVSNPGLFPIGPVRLTDNLPDELHVLSVDASAGTLTRAGRHLRLDVQTIAAGEAVTLQVQTRIKDDVTPPFLIVNEARLQGGDAARDRLISERTIPDTGEVIPRAPSHSTR